MTATLLSERVVSAGDWAEVVPEECSSQLTVPVIFHMMRRDTRKQSFLFLVVSNIFQHGTRKKREIHWTDQCN